MQDQIPMMRQWLLLRTLTARRQGVTVAELATDLGVSVKTIRRDLILLKQLGFPLAESVQEHGKKTWRVKEDWASTAVPFALDEALALQLARRALDAYAGAPFWQAAQSAFRKLRATMSPTAQNYINKWASLFVRTPLGAVDYSQSSDILDQLWIGIEDQKATFITYRSERATEPVTYDIYPYGLIFHRNALYLVGFAPRHDELRHWKVSRILDAETTRVRFQRPADFDLQKHLAGSFGVFHGRDEVVVRVRFSASVARYVQESRWHPTQKLKPCADRGVIAEFQLTSTQEIRAWILSFGRHAEVLAPDTLRAEVIAELTAALDNYAPTRTPQNRQHAS